MLNTDINFQESMVSVSKLDKVFHVPETWTYTIEPFTLQETFKNGEVVSDGFLVKLSCNNKIRFNHFFYNEEQALSYAIETTEKYSR